MNQPKFQEDNWIDKAELFIKNSPAFAILIQTVLCLLENNFCFAVNKMLHGTKTKSALAANSNEYNTYR